MSASSLSARSFFSTCRCRDARRLQYLRWAGVSATIACRQQYSLRSVVVLRLRRRSARSVRAPSS
eukprot:6348806-Prorocentrum_lima.AAC.1